MYPTRDPQYSPLPTPPIIATTMPLPDPEPPQDVYTRLLLRKDPSRGYPLYTPEPDESLPPDYRARGIGIGDVGIITKDGGFDFLFNLCLPADHWLNQVNGVPETFRQVNLRPEDQDHEDMQIISTCSYVEQTNLDGKLAMRGQNLPPSVAGAEIHLCFTTSAAEGAVLVLPDGAKKCDLKNASAFYEIQTEARKNGLSWYKFVLSNLGRIINNSLYIITGYHKASSWCLASFSNAEDNTSFSLNTLPPVGKGISAAYDWEATRNSVVGCVCPHHEYGKPQENQTVFIRGFKISIQENLLAALHEKMEHHCEEPSLITDKRALPSYTSVSNVLPSESVQQGNILGNGIAWADKGMENISLYSLESVINPSLMPLHPSDMINKFLLNVFPDATVAITHDSQWMKLSMWNGLGEHEFIEGICRRFMPIYDPKDNVAYLQPKETIKHIDKVGGQLITTGALEAVGMEDLNLVLHQELESTLGSSTNLHDFQSSDDSQIVTEANTQDSRPSLPRVNPRLANPPICFNMLIVGETGVGKSSVVNLVAGEELAEVHSGSGGCTVEVTPYDIILPDNQGLDHHIRIFDTVGLNEPQFGRVDYLTAIEKANTLICQLQRMDGICLLIFCIRGGRITVAMRNNYRLFCDILCQKNVPVAFVITGLENETPMEGWWVNNASQFDTYGLLCASHACITATRGLNDCYARRYYESQATVRAMLLGYVTGNGESERTGWFTHLTGRLSSQTRNRRRQTTAEELARQLQNKCNFSQSEATYLAGKIWAKRRENARPDFKTFG